MVDGVLTLRVCDGVIMWGSHASVEIHKISSLARLATRESLALLLFQSTFIIKECHANLNHKTRTRAIG